MTPLRSSDLRHRVVLVRPVDVDDEQGGSTTVWQPVGNPWAEVKGQAGRESVMHHVLQGIAVYRLRIRYRDDVDAKQQVILSDGRQLNIRSADDPDGRREQLVIIADTEGTIS